MAPTASPVLAARWNRSIPAGQGIETATHEAAIAASRRCHPGHVTDDLSESRIFRWSIKGWGQKHQKLGIYWHISLFSPSKGWRFSPRFHQQSSHGMGRSPLNSGDHRIDVAWWWIHNQSQPPVKPKKSIPEGLIPMNSMAHTLFQCPQTGFDPLPASLNMHMCRSNPFIYVAGFIHSFRTNPNIPNFSWSKSHIFWSNHSFLWLN